MKGRKPEAAAAQRGTARKRKPAQLAPLEHPTLITPSRTAEIPVPRQLPRTNAVKALWSTLLREVAITGLHEGDLPLMEACVVAKFRHLQAGLLVKRTGILVDEVAYYSQDGEPVMRTVRNPALKEERDQAVLYDRLAQRLGLSPESRVRLNLMQVAGATLLGSLRKTLDEAVESELADIIDAEATEVD